ncbi:MAG: hypothetical protein HYY28_13640 [Betaproteobacteria bacterium]|nr:hypothetical protein [Betaproteobacteria bacterium]
MEHDVAPASRRDSALDHFVRADPLAEDHRLRVGVFQQVFKQRGELVGLDSVIGFPIKEPSAVAGLAGTWPQAPSCRRGVLPVSRA